MRLTRRKPPSSSAESADGYYPPGADLRMLRHVFQSENDQLIPAEQGHYLKIRPLWPRIAVAASIILALSFGGYVLLHKRSSPQTAFNGDLLPDSTRVVLKTGGGKTFLLSSLHNGTLYKQGTMAVTKTAAGQIEYSGVAEVMVYDTLQVPTGGPYHLKLSDGSRITLNTGTTLRYPEKFGSSRELELIAGEAFFNIVHNAHLPMRIKTPTQMITDIWHEV